MESKATEIDPGTYKAIESFRKSLKESHNDIRRVIARVRRDAFHQTTTGTDLTHDATRNTVARMQAQRAVIRDDRCNRFPGFRCASSGLRGKHRASD